MNLKQVVAFSVMALFTTAAFSGDIDHHKIEVKVIADDGNGPTHLILDSEELGFNLDDMQVGENQSIVDEEGRPILISRTEDGFVFDVDGRKIEMPAFDEQGEGRHRVKMIEVESEADVHIISGGPGKHHAMGPHSMMAKEGVMIISGKEIDVATQQVIRDALQSAGHETVHFAGGHGGGPHQVKIIKKVVEVSE